MWYNYNLGDVKDIIKCTKQLVKITRSTLEYDEWQRMIKWNDPNAINCPVCGENYEENNLKCESHHYPRTLFDIVNEVLEEHIQENDLDDKTGLDLVKEIMDLHFMKKVHYINLCVHCHKKFHDGHLKVTEKITKIFDEMIQKEREKHEQQKKLGE